MQNYRIAFILLFGLCVAVYLGFEESDKRFREVQIADTETQTRLEQTRREARELERRLNSLRTGDVEVDRFLQAWQPFSTEEPNPGRIGQTLSDLAVAMGLLGTRRPTPVRQDYPLGGESIAVQIVTFSVNGEFPAVFRWLGQAERAFPLARIESLQLLSRGGTEVELLLAFAFPLHVLPDHRP